MRLVLDLRYAPDERTPDAERVMRLSDLAELGRRPRELAALLWGGRWDEIVVLEDTFPDSGVQAGALGLAALARTRGFEVRRGGVVTTPSRPAFLARAAGLFLRAMPAEALATRRHRRAVRQIGAEELRLPRPAGAPKRVAYLRVDPEISWLGSYVGGAATHTTGVINGLRDNGLDVHVYAPVQPGGTEGVAFTAVPLRRMFHLIHWLTVTDYGLEVARAIERSGERPDFIYQRYALGSYAGLEAARRLGVPLVLEFNGSEIWADKHWGQGQLRNLDLLEPLERRNVAAASLVVVVSEVLKDQLREQGLDPDRVLVNPNGVDVDALSDVRAVAPAEWRRRLGLADAPTIGFIGTFGLWHGVLELPEMVERVAQQEPDARWVLIGDGAHHQRVHDDIAARGLLDHVRMPGIVSHDEAVKLLAASDVCVSPHVPNPDGTPFFGSPTKLFEYMGLGKAIVASDLEQIGEVIQDEQTGLLGEPGDSAGQADAVVRLLRDDRLRDRLGAAALERAQTTYSWKAHVKRILDALS